MEEQRQPGVAERTTQGAAWLIGSRLVARGIDFVLLLVLGRLLGPADFGVVAIAMTLITIVEAIMELPVLQSLIRIPTLNRGHFDTAFTLALMRGLTLTLLLGSLAWPFARFYNDARLFPLICALSLAPAARGLGSPAMALYARDISFHRDFMLEISGKVVSFMVAAVLAYWTKSYWALVASTVMTPVATAIISYIIAPYRPRLSLSEWPSFAGFLGWTSAAQAIIAINWQCDKFLISRLTSRSLLGQFSMANDLSVLPMQALVVPLLRPLNAAFALVREDKPRLRAAYLRTSTTLLVVGIPLMLGLSALAAPAVRLVLGPKWTAAAPILQWLALAAIPTMFVTPLGALAMAMGRTQIFFRQAIIEFFAKIPLVVGGALIFGIPGVIVARLIASVVMARVAMGYVRDLSGLSLTQQILRPWRTLCSGGIMYAALLVARSWTAGEIGILTQVVRLACLAAGGLAVYGSALLLLWQLSGRPEGIEAAILRLAARAPRLRRRADQGLNAG
jgi:O-antigen/teichoic acid export membrane protein